MGIWPSKREGAITDWTVAFMRWCATVFHDMLSLFWYKIQWVKAKWMHSAWAASYDFISPLFIYPSGASALTHGDQLYSPWWHFHYKVPWASGLSPIIYLHLSLKCAIVIVFVILWPATRVSTSQRLSCPVFVNCRWLPANGNCNRRRARHRRIGPSFILPLQILFWYSLILLVSSYWVPGRLVSMSHFYQT